METKQNLMGEEISDSLYLQRKDTSSHSPTVYCMVPYAHAYEYASRRGNIRSLYLQQKDTSSHGATVYRTVPYAHAHEYPSMCRHSPHILASDKDMYVTLMVIMLKYSKHYSPKAQEKH